MFEKIFLYLVFTISTNFFYLMLLPNLLSLPIFMIWLFPQSLRYIVLIFCGIPLVLYGYLFVTKMVPVLKWIHETGETGEVIFSNLVPSGNTINDEPEMVFEGTLKTGTGELIEFEISSGGVLYYPIEVRPPLTTNKIYRVKYRNQYPHFWIVDQGTENEVQKRKECEELKLELQKVQSQLLLKPKDQELLSKVTLLEQKIAQICL